MLDLKSLAGGAGVEIGECVYLPHSPEPLIEIDGTAFLRSGHIIVDEEEEYPEAYALFANPDGSIGIPTVTPNLYMRIK